MADRQVGDDFNNVVDQVSAFILVFGFIGAGAIAAGLDYLNRKSNTSG